MRLLKILFENNRAWAERIKETQPDFFETLAQQQSPDYLWIGCSDSRMPASQLTGVGPGEMFVHRNVANLVIHTDLNCLSVIQFAVDVLKVKHIIVCGHYDCGGVKAALENKKHGLIDNWLRHIQDTIEKYETTLSKIEDENERLDRVCELNVFEQVMNVCQTTIVQDAWERGQNVAVHGFVYGLHDGLLRDMKLCIDSREDASDAQNRGVGIMI
jgi:carbonic anhydrase